MKKLIFETLKLEKIVGGGQALGRLASGKKAFVWGGLPGETVTMEVTKSKSSFIEGVVTEVLTPSSERAIPADPESYLSTSPWQIMSFEAESRYKAVLIQEAFELHDIALPHPIQVFADGRMYEYRNKIEYSFWFDTEKNKLDLAFFRRGSHGKIAVLQTSLAMPAITAASIAILRVLNDIGIEGRALKTLLIRCSQQGDVAWQLYVKDMDFPAKKVADAAKVNNMICGEVIYSEPKSPASVATKRLYKTSDETLSDTILGVPFRYATEGFFQVNIPVYEQALKDMREWVLPGKPVLDLYSGVGSIGLTIGGEKVTLVEVNEAAVSEMERNIAVQGKKGAKAVLAASEHALDYISSDACIIVDPPRAGLHAAVVEKLLAEKPPQIIYLSCNPATQARDIKLLSEKYHIVAHQGYNFFPRTPHIEHLVVLDLVSKG